MKFFFSNSSHVISSFDEMYNQIYNRFLPAFCHIYLLFSMQVFHLLLVFLLILLHLEAVGSVFLNFPLPQPSIIEFRCKGGTNSQEPYSYECVNSCHPSHLFVTSHVFFQMPCIWSMEKFLCCGVLQRRMTYASIHRDGLLGNHHEWDMWALSSRR